MTKRPSNNPNGRPPKPPGEKYVTPNRNLGRVDEATWQMLKEAAKREGHETFIAWALPILVRAAKRTGKT